MPPPLHLSQSGRNLGTTHCVSFALQVKENEYGYDRKRMIDETIGVNMVTDCSLEFELRSDDAKLIKKQCMDYRRGWLSEKLDLGEDLYKVLPVTIGQVTFANYYCALCNFVRGGDFKFWEIITWAPTFLPKQVSASHVARYPMQSLVEDPRRFSLRGASRMSQLCFNDFYRSRDECNRKLVKKNPGAPCRPVRCAHLENYGCESCFNETVNMGAQQQNQ